MDRTLLLIMIVIFLATLIRSALGFGEALISVPLLAMIIPIRAAVPLAALVSITIAAVVVIQDFRHINLPSAGRLVLATIPGIPLGLLLLAWAPAGIVKAILGIIIILFALYSLLNPRPVRLTNDRRAWAFGLAAGILGGAYGMNGPPLVVYGTLRGFSPARFRATLQGYFLPASLLGMLGYYILGYWTPTVTHYYLVCLLPMFIAILMGRTINQRMERRVFMAAVNIGLIAVGILLLMQV